MQPLDPAARPPVRARARACFLRRAAGRARRSPRPRLIIAHSRGCSRASSRASIDGMPVRGARADPRCCSAARSPLRAAAALAARSWAAPRGRRACKAQLRAGLLAAVGALGPGWLADPQLAAARDPPAAASTRSTAYFGRYLPQLVLTVVATPMIVARDVVAGLDLAALTVRAHAPAHPDLHGADRAGDPGGAAAAVADAAAAGRALPRHRRGGCRRSRSSAGSTGPRHPSSASPTTTAARRCGCCGSRSCRASRSSSWRASRSRSSPSRSASGCSTARSPRRRAVRAAARPRGVPAAAAGRRAVPRRGRGRRRDGRRVRRARRREPRRRGRGSDAPRRQMPATGVAQPVAAIRSPSLDSRRAPRRGDGDRAMLPPVAPGRAHPAPSTLIEGRAARASRASSPRSAAPREFDGRVRAYGGRRRARRSPRRRWLAWAGQQPGLIAGIDRGRTSPSATTTPDPALVAARARRWRARTSSTRTPSSACRARASPAARRSASPSPARSTGCCAAAPRARARRAELRARCRHRGARSWRGVRDARRRGAAVLLDLAPHERARDRRRRRRASRLAR